MTERIHAWQTDDGDRWLAEGHHSDDEMREAAARAETEALWRDVTAADFAAGTVSRVWLRPLEPDDEESPLQSVESTAPGAAPWTVLDAEIDWDEIDARPQRRPSWAP